METNAASLEWRLNQGTTSDTHVCAQPFIPPSTAFIMAIDDRTFHFILHINYIICFTVGIHLGAKFV